MTADVSLTLSQAMQLALDRFNIGDWIKAEQLARFVLDSDERHFGALSLLGILAAQTHRLEEAACLLSHAAATRPADAYAHNNYGNILNELRRFEEALESYERAVQIKPDYAEAYYNRGSALVELMRFEEAVDSYSRALQVMPRYAEAHNNCGNAFRALNRLDEALESFAQALKINPELAEAHNNQGRTLHELKRFEEALDCFASALRINAVFAEAYCNRADTLLEIKRFDEALESYDRALQIKPDFAEACNNRGNALRSLKRLEEACASYADALKIRQTFSEAHNNRGAALLELDRAPEALTSIARAIEIRPDFAEAYNNRGAALHELRRFEEALESFECALNVKPTFSEAWNNRGNTLRNLGRLDQALDSYARAIELDPGYAEAHSNRGDALREAQHLEEALNSILCALRLNPRLAESHNNLGATLQDLNRFEEALNSYGRALKIKPDFAKVLINRGGLLLEQGQIEAALSDYTSARRIDPGSDWLLGVWMHTKMHLCDWSDFDSELAELNTRILQANSASPPFPVLALIDRPSLQLQSAKIWVRARHPPSLLLTPIEKYARHKKIRIGYFSCDFRSHPVSLLAANLFERHDRSRFEVTAFSFGPDTKDQMRKRLERGFDRFIDVRGMPDREIVRLARGMELDIAVDLAGFTKGSRPNLFALRVAPLQVSYLGYLGTMGAGYMDYLIADEIIMPGELRRHYAEKIVYLPSYQANDSGQLVSDRKNCREELGLPRNGFVFCCVNATYKILPATFDSWMRILRQVKDSVLFLISENATVQRNLRREAWRRGVSEDRLVFGRRLPHPEYLARFCRVDLFLDTLPYNAGTTASDALRAGLPVLTRMGESFAARIAASLLHAIGLPELATTSEEQYETTAVTLAREPTQLAALKDRLCRNRSSMPLFDTAQFTTHLERAYAQMYERYCADLDPDDIRIS